MKDLKDISTADLWALLNFVSDKINIEISNMNHKQAETFYDKKQKLIEELDRRIKEVFE